jgi:hypothetical protein
MMTSWAHFGCSQGMEADLDDSFMFLNHLMLLLWEDVGCSWGLKPVFDDRFTF